MLLPRSLGGLVMASHYAISPRALTLQCPRQEEGMSRRVVLVLGPSGTAYSEAGPEATTPALIQRELAIQDPLGGWVCERRELHYGARMAERASKIAAELTPAVVVLHLPVTPFLEDAPLARLRRLQPRAYPLARRLAIWLKANAGDKATGLRSGLYRLPRAAAARLIGAEPEVPLHQAVDFAVQTIGVLLTMEDCTILCRQPISLRFVSGVLRGEKYQRRLDAFNNVVGPFCRKRHVVYYDCAAEMLQVGVQIAPSLDGQHADLNSRSFEARLVAGLILRPEGKAEAVG